MADNKEISIGKAIDFACAGLGLADHGREQYTQQSDRMGVVGAGYLVSAGQMAVTPTTTGHREDEKYLSAFDKPATKSTQGERFFLLDQREWSVGDPSGVDLLDLDIAAALQQSEYAVDGLLKYHRFGRFGVHVGVQINATSFQQGGLICMLYPGNNDDWSYVNGMTWCSGILNCNVNNEVYLKSPFMYTRNQYNFREPQYPMTKLKISVWAQLYCAADTSQTVTVSVVGRLVDLEMHGICPVPTSQGLTNEFKIEPGIDVMNLCNKNDTKARSVWPLDRRILDQILQFLEDRSVLT